MHRVVLLSLIGFAILVSADVARSQDKGIGDFPKLSPKTDWPWWRGPKRNGYADTTPVPTTLNASTNVVWKTPVPGRGHSSPTVVGDRIFIETADERQQVHSVVAFDRTTGKQLWKTDVSTGGFPEANHPKNTEATPTPASDGDRLFVSFYHHDHVEAIALDFSGKILWRTNCGHFRPTRYEYGYAPSPLIYRNTVIITAEFDGDSYIAALDRASGKIVWKTPRPNNTTFSSPVVAHVAGRDQMLISGGEKVESYDPATGKSLWSAQGTTWATCGTIVWDGDVVFASGGYPKPETVAVRADGSGQVLWKNNQKCYEQSMLAYDGYLYALTDNGVMYCWRGSDGKEMWKTRLRGPVSASPVLANGHIYWANELGTMYVFRPTPAKFDLVAENQILNESFASPAICGGQIILRVADNSSTGRQEWLYCFANRK